MPGSLINIAASAFGFTMDDLIARVLKPANNHYLDGAGSVREAEANITDKSARITHSMDGEDRPVTIQVERYSIEPSGHNAELVVHKWSSPSHAWLDTIGKKFNPEIKLYLPVPYAVWGGIF